MRYFSTLLCITLLVFQSSCNGNKGAEELKTVKQLRFVFITTCEKEDFFIPVRKGMADAASLLGVDCSFTGTEEVDLRKQAEMVEEATRQGVDGIALSIIDTLAFDDVVQNAVNKGIPVVAFNVDDRYTPNARLSGIAQNFYKAGFDLGERVSEQIPENSTVFLTMHSYGISALNERVRGEMDALKKRNITGKVLITGTDPEGARDKITDELINHPEITAIICTGQADTEGAGLAIESRYQGRGYLAAGFDLSPEILRLIKSGYILCTVDQQPYMQGFYPVVQLYQYCRYGILPGDTEIVASFVDRDNVENVEKLCAGHFR